MLHYKSSVKPVFVYFNVLMENHQLDSISLVDSLDQEHEDDEEANDEVFIPGIKNCGYCRTSSYQKY